MLHRFRHLLLLLTVNLYMSPQFLEESFVVWKTDCTLSLLMLTAIVKPHGVGVEVAW
jgi:hypothetical protein